MAACGLESGRKSSIVLLLCTWRSQVNSQRLMMFELIVATAASTKANAKEERIHDNNKSGRTMELLHFSA